MEIEESQNEQEEESFRLECYFQLFGSNICVACINLEIRNTNKQTRHTRQKATNDLHVLSFMQIQIVSAENHVIQKKNIGFDCCDKHFFRVCLELLKNI